MKRALAWMAGVAALAVVTPSAGASQRYWDRCGDIDYGSGIYDIKSHNIDCSIAAIVIRHYYKRGDHHFAHWTCRSHQLDEALYHPVCKGGIPGQIMKFVTVVAPGVERYDE